MPMPAISRPVVSHGGVDEQALDLFHRATWQQLRGRKAHREGFAQARRQRLEVLRPQAHGQEIPGRLRGAEHLLVDRQHLGMTLRVAGHSRRYWRLPGVTFKQGAGEPAVRLAVGGQRQGVDLDEPRGYMGLRQQGPGMLTQRHGAGRRTVAPYIQRADAGLALLRVAIVHHQHLLHRRMADQLDLDVRQRHPHAAHLHVTVDPAVEQQHAVLAVAATVTGTEGTHWRAVIVEHIDEVALHQFAVLQVAQGQAHPTGVDTPGDALRAMRAVLVQQPVAQAQAAQTITLTAGQEHFEDGRDRAPEAHAVLPDQLVPAQRILFLAGLGQHQRRPGAQAAEHVEQRHVVVQRGHRDEHIVAADLPLRQGAADDIGGGAVVQHHALGLAGGAGGVQVVGRRDGDHLTGAQPAGLECPGNALHTLPQFGIADAPLAMQQGDASIVRAEQVVGDAPKEIDWFGLRLAAVQAVVAKVDELPCVDFECNLPGQLRHRLVQDHEQLSDPAAIDCFAGIVDLERQPALGGVAETDVHGHLRRLGQARAQVHRAIDRAHRPGQAVGQHHR
ncbi:hypothetical protein WR25_15766 [Diploscapter pachys]|uniref:Uncharacterized protein n=1 Tax=Diploscapter pachys TaxID=2018661 RepID=A0A2A2KBB0_9BILA|nr:hypothetical protein WR25_15766 [Diploscapter pachys]